MDFPHKFVKFEFWIRIPESEYWPKLGITKKVNPIFWTY